MYRARLATTVAAIVFSVIAFDVTAQSPDPESPRYKGVMALQEFLSSEGDEALTAFADDRIATAWREEIGDEHMFMMLTGLREEFAGLESRGARPTGRLAVTLMFQGDDGGKRLSFTLDPDDTDRFTALDMET